MGQGDGSGPLRFKEEVTLVDAAAEINALGQNKNRSRIFAGNIFT